MFSTIDAAPCDGWVDPSSTRRQDRLSLRHVPIVARAPGASMDPNQSVAAGDGMPRGVLTATAAGRGPRRIE
ncbi:MAG: hypothetical protein JO034_03280 [Singulisphaera sp.]|nr:hypothetical protein [Singulisphaera sp.]